MQKGNGGSEVQRELKYVSGLQRLLVEISRAFLAGGSTDFDGLVHDALAHVGEHCSVDRSYVFRFLGSGSDHANTHEWCAPGIEPRIQSLQQVRGDVLPALMDRITHHQAVRIASVPALAHGWEAERAFFAGHGIRSLVIAPILVDGELYGHMGFDSVRRERVWSDEEVRLLQGLADIIGAAIHRDYTEGARHAIDARFRAIAEHLPGNVFQRTMDAEGRIHLTYLLLGDRQAYGLDPARIPVELGELLEVIHPADRAFYEHAVRESARTMERHDIAFRMRAADGGYRWIRTLARPRRLEDGSVIWDGIAIDETERTLAEEQLRDTKALLEIAGRAARLGGWNVDLVNNRVTWSDEVCAIHEVPPGTRVTPDESLTFYAPEDRERVRRLFRACVRDGTPFDEELSIITAQGNRVWVRTISEAVCDDDGRTIQVRGAFQDITEQRRAREEIHRLADRLTTTLESITDAFLTVDNEWRITFVNREAETLTGRSREDLLGRILWEEFPEAIGTRVEQEYERAVRQGVAVEFQEYYPRTGRWFEARAYPSEEGLAVYFRDITQRKRAQEEIEFLALYDPLTQLPNRRLLTDRLQHALATQGRSGRYGAVLFLDLDNFKTLNDTLGHETGDKLLQEAARRLTEALRQSDTVARFGGDEFVVVLADLDGVAAAAALQAEAVADKILAVLTRPYQLGEHQRHMTVSIGITLFGSADDSVDDLMQRVDLAMYQAKDAGRGTTRVYSPEMRASMQARVRLEAELREGLERGEITAHYQPQFDMAGRLIGAEALARWQHPRRGVVGPGEFISAAEESGLILALGETVLREACARLADWAARLPAADFSVAVNVSARQFHHPGFVEQVRRALEETRAAPQALRLELTESLLLADLDDTVARMDQLKSIGVRFSLDDFGTGYSSLAYLKRLPLDQLKIDRVFVRDAVSNPNDAAIVRTIILLAESMGLGVIAEGVETEAERAMLEEYGCGALQGYLLGAPVPAGEFQHFLPDGGGSVPPHSL